MSDESQAAQDGAAPRYIGGSPAPSEARRDASGHVADADSVRKFGLDE